MDTFETHYYRINKFLLSVVGLWPHLNSRTKRNRLLFFKFVFGIMFFVQVAKVITTTLDLNLFIEMCSNFIVSLCIAIVYFCCCFKEKQLHKMINHIQDDWRMIESEEEYAILKKYAGRTRIYTLLTLYTFFGTIYSFFFFMLLPIILDIILPLNEPRHHDILFPIETFFDTSEYFYISFTLVFVVLNALGFASIASYTILFVFVQHSNGLFELVGHIFENAIDDKNITMDPEEEKKIYDKLVRGIWFHKRTLKYVHTLNSTCQACYLIEIALAGIAVGFDILRLLQTPFTMENAKEISSCFIHIYGNVIWVLLHCYFGQEVIDHSSDVRKKVFNSKWYTATTKIQKLILMVITKSMKPSYMSIGKMFASSLEFFLSILQMIISYSMVFYSLRQ